jgi:hypothetical protein
MLAREKKRVPEPARSINNNIRLTNTRLRPAVAQSVVTAAIATQHATTQVCVRM